MSRHILMVKVVNNVSMIFVYIIGQLDIGFIAINKTNLIKISSAPVHCKDDKLIIYFTFILL